MVRTHFVRAVGPVVPTNSMAYVLAMVQCMVGVILNVLLFAVIVTKFQKPQPKLVFAERICFATRNGSPVLLMRVGNLRCNTLHDLQLTLTMLVTVQTAEGENRVQMIPLEVSQLATMTAVATFTHKVTRESPLYGMTEDMCRNSAMRLQAVIR
eukprot:scaffold339_cov402-Prasinococcus_capsulatus_cf.AAC.18